MAAPLGPSTTLYGSCFARFSTSENLRPISLFAEKMVLPGFVMAWRLAACPTSLSPDLVKATTDGVVLPPSLFGITVLSPPSMTAMQEFVVPKSIPNILLICHKVKHSPCQNQTQCGELQYEHITQTVNKRQKFPRELPPRAPQPQCHTMCDILAHAGAHTARMGAKKPAGNPSGGF